MDAIRRSRKIPGTHPRTPTTKRRSPSPHHPPTGAALRQPPPQPPSDRNAHARRGPNGNPHQTSIIHANGIREAEPRKRPPARRNRPFMAQGRRHAPNAVRSGKKNSGQSLYPSRLGTSRAGRNVTQQELKKGWEETAAESKTASIRYSPATFDLTANLLPRGQPSNRAAKS